MKKIALLSLLIVIICAPLHLHAASYTKEDVKYYYGYGNREKLKTVYVKDDDVYLYSYDPDKTACILTVTNMVDKEKKYDLKYYIFDEPLYIAKTKEYVTLTVLDDEYAFIKSKDLINWTISNKIDYRAIVECNNDKIVVSPEKLIYCDNQYILFGNVFPKGSFQTMDTTVAVSKDLVNWEFKGVFDFEFQDAASGNDVIIATGEQTKLLISPDSGNSWEMKQTSDHYMTNDILAYFDSICFADGRFVIAGSEIYKVARGTKTFYDFSCYDVIVTKDGQTFEKYDVGEYCENISYNENSGLFIMVDVHDRMNVFVSENARDWTFAGHIKCNKDTAHDSLLYPYKNGFIIYNDQGRELYTFNTDSVKRNQSGKFFKDIKWEDWFYKYFDTLYERKIIDGFSDQTVRPGSKLTRDQFIKMIIAGLAPNETFTAKSGYWAQPYLDKAKSLNIISDDMFDDYKLEITRGETACIIANVLNAFGKGSLSETDSALLQNKIPDFGKIQSEQQASVLQVYAEGIITGYPDGSFGAENGLTRAESMAIIVRLLNLLEE